MVLLGMGEFGAAYCPEQPNDNGTCDTLYAICHDSVEIDSPPWEAHISLLVTHDVPAA